MKKKLGVILIILFVINSMTLNAANAARNGKADFAFKINYLESMQLNGENGSGVAINDDVGWGFEFGYNYSDHLNISFEFMYNQPGYTATVISDEEDNQREITTRNKLDILTYQLNATYNFTSNDITPFISGGFGWSYMDSNVPNGRYEEYCVWDPWYGYVCAGFQDTYDAYNFSYNAKAGVRWDIDRKTYVTASYNNVWYDLDHADTLSSGAFQIQIGMKY